VVRGALSSIDVRAIRPEFEVILSRIADETLERQGRERVEASGMGVTVCGPKGLCEGVRSSILGIEGWKRRGCGGIELEVEHFGF
jgi:ferric-chelate reductase